MADLIDRDALKKAIRQSAPVRPEFSQIYLRDRVNFEIAIAPAVDAVEVIRCKDCLFWTGFKLSDGTECEGVCDIGEERCITNSNGYCYWAEEAIRIDAD